jgi:penicillin-binding protein 2
MIINDPNKPLLNRATNGIYPPGSIFKMVVLIELLERNLVSTEWSVLCTGEYEYFDRVHRCWDENGHGKINMKDALVQSCDIYFYEAVQKIKLDNLYLRAEEFGYGQESNIDLPNEMKGRMPNRDFMNKLYGKWGWSKGALLNIAIGQGEILSTPVQMANYTNLIATNGETYPLNLVRSKIDKLNRPQVELKNWQIIQDAMREVVIGEKGTGKLSDPKLPGLSIYGKTGTAENPHGEAHAWYITYGEKNNEMISIVVLIENGGSGGTYATPIARKIYNYYFNSNKSKLAKN